MRAARRDGWRASREVVPFRDRPLRRSQDQSRKASLWISEQINAARRPAGAQGRKPHFHLTLDSDKELATLRVLSRDDAEGYLCARARPSASELCVAELGSCGCSSTGEAKKAAASRRRLVRDRFRPPCASARISSRSACAPAVRELAVEHLATGDIALRLTRLAANTACSSTLCCPGTSPSLDLPEHDRFRLEHFAQLALDGFAHRLKPLHGLAAPAF